MPLHARAGACSLGYGKGTDEGQSEERAVDPFGHPDLQRLGRTLRNRLDDTLIAEQEAARSAALRRRTLRDRLIESADREERVVVGTSDGHALSGVVIAVGVDHLVLADDVRERYVALAHIVTLESR